MTAILSPPQYVNYFQYEVPTMPGTLGPLPSTQLETGTLYCGVQPRAYIDDQ